MKAERIQTDKVYMAVVKGRELLIKVDLVILNHVHGKVIETGAGIALHADAFQAGPLNIGPKNRD